MRAWATICGAATRPIVMSVIAGAPVADARAAATALQGASGSVEATVLRNGETLNLTLSL